MLKEGKENKWEVETSNNRKAGEQGLKEKKGKTNVKRREDRATDMKGLWKRQGIENPGQKLVKNKRKYWKESEFFF